MDYLTVLRSNRVRVTKLWRADGTIDAAPNALNFTVEYPTVSDIRQLSAKLTEIQNDTHCCVIRGVFKPNAPALCAAENVDGYQPGALLRRLSVTDDVARYWCMLDVDKYNTPLAATNPEAACREFIADHLPPAFQGVEFHWQLSSSAGHPKNDPTALKAHLWFWLTVPYTSPQLAAWARSLDGRPVDAAMFRQVQPHFTANPEFEPGVVDPVPVRSGLAAGALASAALHIDDAILATAVEETSASRAGKLRDAEANDPIARLLDERELILGRHRDGGLFIRCPREEFHNAPAKPDDTSTVYYPANTGGYALGHFVCMHDHCRDLPDAEFKRALGYNPIAGVFGPVGAPQPAQAPTARAVDTQDRAAPIAPLVTIESFSTLHQWAKGIETADFATMQGPLMPGIRDDTSLTDIERRQLAEQIRMRFKNAFQTPMPIAEIRAAITPRAASQDIDAGDAPEWLHEWVYINQQDKFINLNNGVALSRSGFKGNFNALMPLGENGGRADADKMVLDEWGIRKVDATMYWPAVPQFFTHDGRQYANAYRLASVPQVQPVNEAAPGLERFKSHLYQLCNRRADVYFGMMAWLAHNVQKPGQKIRFAPIIKGVEGDGKSTIFNALQAMMGTANTFSATSDILTSQFNSYAHGFAAVAIEEMYVSGKDRYMVINKIKPWVSNPNLMHHAKGEDPATVVNTTNWIGFTNHTDALPISDTDRRWWVIFSPFASLAQYETVLGIAPGRLVKDHFHQIHDSMQRWPGQWRQFFLDWQIPDTFDANGVAPMTDEKSSMAAAERSDEWLNACLEILDEGKTEGVSRLVVSSSELIQAASFKVNTEIRRPQGSAVPRLLDKLGFHPLGFVLKWRGKTRTIYIQPGVSTKNAEITEILNSTVQDANPNP